MQFPCSHVTQDKPLHVKRSQYQFLYHVSCTPYCYWVLRDLSVSPTSVKFIFSFVKVCFNLVQWQQRIFTVLLDLGLFWPSLMPYAIVKWLSNATIAPTHEPTSHVMCSFELNGTQTSCHAPKRVELRSWLTMQDSIWGTTTLHCRRDMRWNQKYLAFLRSTTFWRQNRFGPPRHQAWFDWDKVRDIQWRVPRFIANRDNLVCHML